jgi:Domain of unknown function (DUF4157)
VTTLGTRLATEAARTMSRRRARLLMRAGPPGVAQRAAIRAVRYRRIEPPVASGPPVVPPPRKGGDPVPPQAREALRPVLGAAVDALRLHDDRAADAIASRHNADAVSAGTDVFFRRGRLRLHERAGIALLAHEATHALEQARPGADWRRSTAAGRDAEERRALSVERAILAGTTVAPPPARFAAAPSSSASSPAREPAAAAQDRPLVQPAATSTPAIDVAELRQQLHRELLMQIRTDFERGG